MKNQKNKGEFLKWFCDKVYALSNLFYGDDDEIYARRLPEIEASLFEIRAARLKIGSVYSRVAGMKECLVHVDNVVYEVEEYVAKGRISMEERKVCMEMLLSCTGDLLEIWYRMYFRSSKGQQAKLEGPEKALLAAL